MNDIMLGKSTYTLLESFSTSILETPDIRSLGLENRKIFLRSLGKDKFLKVKEVSVPPPKAWFKNKDYLVVCADDRYKFKSIYTINQLIKCVEEVSIYKIKKENKWAS